MKRYIETDHAPHLDITFIMEFIETDEGEPVKTSVIGWYYGEPNEENTAQYIGKLTATY